MKTEIPPKNPKFSLVQAQDQRVVKLMKKTDQKILALWAIACAKRVLPYFEKKYPKDQRPRNALATLQTWIKTGVFSMAVIRGASLDAHAAAREAGEDNAARSAARAAGQAVATAHVATHSLGAAIYALQAIYRNNPATAPSAVKKEQDWQYWELVKLRKNVNKLVEKVFKGYLK